MTGIANPRFPHMCRILRYADTDPMQDQPQSLSSDGAACCFCCSEVQDEWTEETMPLEGDKVEVIKNGFKEYGQVIDKRPGNLGTHILWKYVRN